MEIKDSEVMNLPLEAIISDRIKLKAIGNLPWRKEFLTDREFMNLSLKKIFERAGLDLGEQLNSKRMNRF